MKLISLTLLITVALFSCRVHHTHKLTRAYVNCVSGDSIRINSDSLNYFLHRAKGKLEPGYLAKGASKIKMDYRNGKRRTMQIIWGHQTTFHFSKGFRKNIWYTFKDTTVDEQWHTFFNRTISECQNR